MHNAHIKHPENLRFQYPANPPSIHMQSQKKRYICVSQARDQSKKRQGLIKPGNNRDKIFKQKQSDPLTGKLNKLVSPSLQTDPRIGFQ